MEITGKKILYIVILIAVLLIGIASGYGLFKAFGDKEKVIEYVRINSIETKTDTLTRYIDIPSIEIRGRSDTVIVRDTVKVIETHPFTAMIDTIILKDTVQIQYWYPEDIFNVYLHRQAIENKEIIKYITTTEIRLKEPEWWEMPAYIVGGVVVGYGLGNIK